MKNIVLVAPFFRENTNRYIRGLARHANTIRLGIISQEPLEGLEPALRERVSAHFQVSNSLDGAELTRACRGLTVRMGPIDRLLGPLEQLQVPVAEAREAVGIEGMWTEAAHNFRDKNKMKEVLRRAGVPVARSRLLTSEHDAWSFVQEVGFPIVVKPPAGLGSKGTWRIRNTEEMRETLSQLRPSGTNPVQAEEFVTGQENTCETITIRGKHVWHSGTRYLPGPLEVLENPWMQYCVLLPRDEAEPNFTSFQPVNRAALDALGMDTGISHMEWFRRKDGAAVVSEVGARPPGAGIMPLMSVANDTDMIDRWCDLMVTETWPQLKRKYAAGCAFFRGQGTGRVKAVHGLDRAQEEIGSLVVQRQLPQIGQQKASSYEGEGWAVVRHEDTKVVLHALRRLVSLVRVEYA